MSERVSISLTVNEGDVLKGFSWASNAKAKGNVVIFEGMEEHVSRYDAFAKFLNENGYNVYALDTYGQGENVAPDMSDAGIWPDDGFAKMVCAHHEMVEEARKNGLPTYIFSHSMGSFMGQDYIQRFSGDVEKVVLCGAGSKNPAVGPGLLVAKMVVNKKNKYQKAKLLNNLMFGNFNKIIKEPRTGYDWLSYNQENVDKYIADPLCGFGPTNGFCLEFIKGMAPLFKKKNFERVSKDQKLFIITGEEDPVSNYSKFTLDLEKRYKAIGLKDVSIKVYKGMRHEILNEDGRQEVYNDILEFFNKQKSSLALVAQLDRALPS